MLVDGNIQVKVGLLYLAQKRVTRKKNPPLLSTPDCRIYWIKKCTDCCLLLAFLSFFFPNILIFSIFPRVVLIVCFICSRRLQSNVSSYMHFLCAPSG